MGYIPFPMSGGALLFHLISKIYEKTSVIITTCSIPDDHIDPRPRQGAIRIVSRMGGDAAQAASGTAKSWPAPWRWRAS